MLDPRRLRFAFAVLALLLAALAAPAVAEEPAAEALFLTPACDAAVDFDADRSEPLPLTPPDKLYTGPCSVSRVCDDGSQIACTGSSTCSSGPGQGGGYVDCDGNVTWCPYDPNCNAGSTCTQASQCYCYGYVCGCINRHCTCISP